VIFIAKKTGIISRIIKDFENHRALISIKAL
jgi:hypothetical protein